MLDVSIVLPLHNEQDRIARCVAMLDPIILDMQARGWMVEALLVLNGCTDGTTALARGLARSRCWMSVHDLLQPGKGRAVRYGMLEARGARRIYADCDWSMHPSQLVRMVRHYPTQHVVIASRAVPGAQRRGEPLARYLASRGYNRLVRALISPLRGVLDTQCGYKCWTSKAAAAVFPRVTETGWAFDVQALRTAALMGYTLVEMPIAWQYGAGSKIHLVRDTLRMGADLVRLAREVQ